MNKATTAGATAAPADGVATPSVDPDARPLPHLPGAAERPDARLTPTAFALNVLNGLALGIVITLIPGALLGEISKALLPHAPWLQMVIEATTLAISGMGLVVGIVIGQMFKLSPIQSAAVGMATMYAAGAVGFTRGVAPAMTLRGSGDIITMGLTAAMAVGMIKLMGDGLKSYAMIVYPPFVTVVCGIVGRLILPYSLQITRAVGVGVKQLTTLQPVVMGVLIAIVFSILIMTPITTVAIALAISLAGIGAGAGNVGVCAAAFGFALLGWRVNSHGTSLAHFIGSPKMSMATMVKKPIIMAPIICAAAISGAVSVLLGIVGTPMSAGFGISGLVGPLGYFGLAGWGPVTIVKAVVGFVLVPVASCALFGHLFKRSGIIKDEDYFLDVH